MYNNQFYNSLVYSTSNNTSNNTSNSTSSKKENKNKEKIKFHLEEEVTIDDLNVRGFFDMVAEVDGKFYLYDLKSSASYSWRMKF